MQVRTLDGITIAADSSGRGDPLCLLHQEATSRRVFERLVPAIDDRWSVAWYDARGSGDSGGGYELEFDPVQDLYAVVKARGWTSVHLLGVGPAGIVALEAALVSPEKVRSVVVLNTATPGYNQVNWSERVQPQLQSWFGEAADVIERMREGDDDAVREFAAVVAKAANIPENLLGPCEADLEREFRRKAPGWQGRAPRPKRLRRIAGLDDLSRVGVPVTVVAAVNPDLPSSVREDQQDQGRVFAEHLPKGRFVELTSRSLDSVVYVEPELVAELLEEHRQWLGNLAS